MSGLTEADALLEQLAAGARLVRATPAEAMRAMASNPEIRIQLQAAATQFREQSALFAKGAQETRETADFIAKALRKTAARYHA